MTTTRTTVTLDPGQSSPLYVAPGDPALDDAGEPLTIYANAVHDTTVTLLASETTATITEGF